MDEFKARVHFTAHLHYTKKIIWNNHSWVILNCYFGSFIFRVWTTCPPISDIFWLLGNLQTSCAAFTSKASITLWPKIVRRKLFQVWRLWPQRPSWSSYAHRWSKRTCGPRMFFTYWIKKIKVIFFQWLGWCHTLRLRFVRSLVGINDYVLLLRSFFSEFSQNPEGLFVRTLDTKADLERGVPWMLSNKDISIKEAKNTCVLCPAIYDTKVLLHLTFLPLRISISKLCRCREVKCELPMLLLFRGPNSSEQRCLGSLFLEPL